MIKGRTHPTVSILWRISIFVAMHVFQFVNRFFFHYIYHSTMHTYHSLKRLEWVSRGHDRLVLGFTAPWEISAYLH